MTNSLIDKNEMDEIIKSLLNQVISSLVLKAFNLNKPARYSVSKSLPIYLNYIDQDTVNLEFIEMFISPTTKKIYDPNLNKYVRQGDLVKFYKPIGFYNRHLELTILNEYYINVEELKNIGLIRRDMQYKSFSLIYNAIIAAFSMETCLNAKNFVDCSIISNGLEIDLLLTYDRECVQSFLNNKYHVDGILGAYMKVNEDEDDLSLNSSIEHKKTYDLLYRKQLLTAYNRL